MTDNPLPVGTELHVAVRVATSEQPIELRAQVRWLLLPAEHPESAGMGVKFIEVPIDTLLTLNAYFASLTGTES